jgi:uncharacterized protein YfdQ (DUF2303 family)
MAYEKDPDDNNTQAAIDAGMCLGEPHLLDKDGTVLGVILPKGAQLQQLDLEKYLPTPRRKRGEVTLATAASFIDWVNRNKTPETVIYAKESNTSFLAIFNGHEANKEGVAGNPGWGDFTSRYDCPLSDEWKRWMEQSQHDTSVDSKKAMKHAEFIQFIEDNLLDITKPSSGLMLAAVRAFEAKRDVKFASAKRLDNGDVSFAYAEDTVQQLPPGTLALPSVFEVTIPVFQGGTPYVISANLRYRVTSGGLFLWYELVRPHKSLEHAFQQVGAQILEGTTVPTFNT